jgi:hypothetical protein
MLGMWSEYRWWSLQQLRFRRLHISGKTIRWAFHTRRILDYGNTSLSSWIAGLVFHVSTVPSPFLAPFLCIKSLAQTVFTIANTFPCLLPKFIAV